MADQAHFHESVLAHARKDFALLQASMTVDEALAAIRQHGVGERIIYFYVADEDGRLAGVLPTRRLLSSAPEAKLADLMVRRVVSVPETATLLDALELFVLYKFFAFPVLDAERKVVAVIDVSSFTEEVMDFTHHYRFDIRAGGAVGAPRIEARSQDRRRPDHPRLGGCAHADPLLQPRYVATVAFPMCLSSLLFVVWSRIRP
jgi:CBS domain-containing protein